MIKILFIIWVSMIGCLASASGVLAVEKGCNSFGASAEIIKFTKEAKVKEKTNLIEPEYYVTPVGNSSQHKSSGDAKSDRITHREITSANTRRGENITHSDSSPDGNSYYEGGVPLHQKAIDSARGPNSMADGIRNNQHLNRSQNNKSGGSAYIPPSPSF